MTSLKEKLGYIVIAAIPVCLWAKAIQYYFYTKRVRAEQVIDHDKHNSIVIYCKDNGMSGWPPYPQRLNLSLNNVQKFKEPIIYFIDTAEHQIDICVMILYCPDIINALEKAVIRGVKLRLILDPRYDNNSAQMRQLIMKGAKILYDVKVLHIESMMHNKYAVKDFDLEDHSGFVVCGSMNWTQTAFTDNYEYLVFSTNSQVVGAFSKNFEEMWDYLKEIKESNEMNESIFKL